MDWSLTDAEMLRWLAGTLGLVIGWLARAGWGRVRRLEKGFWTVIHGFERDDELRDIAKQATEVMRNG